jgi:protein-tyrosine phosphatase
MATEICDIRNGTHRKNALERSAEILAAGGLVVIPTETVYGVAANALSLEAMTELRHLKQRPADHPFTVHIDRPERAADYLNDIPPYAKRIMARGWPGPLTLVFTVVNPAKTKVVRKNAGPQARALFHRDTIGLRCPDHGFAQALLGRLEFPVVAASANAAGGPPPSEAAGIARVLGPSIELVVDAGPCRYAKPSTVARVGEPTFKILREGIVDDRMLRNYASLNILLICTGNTCRSPMAEVMLRRMLSEKLSIPTEMLDDAGFRVSSAGLYGLEGAPASEGARQAVQQRGLDLSGHVARAVDVGMLQQASHIWTMCRHHLEGVVAMVPSIKDRTRLLADDKEIEDPIGQPQERYDRCAEELAESLQARLEELEL